MEKTPSKTKSEILVRPRLLRVSEGRGGVLVLALVALLLSYLLASRALDTGSWQQYFLAFLLLIFSINRFIRAIKGNNHDQN